MDIAMGELLPHVDEVHLLTSLAGFEALLRGKKVTCYGQPFYAGWGLTTDIVPIERRTRRLYLDELVAATLILYPTYISRVTHHYTTAEQALEELLLWRTDTSYQLPFWRKALRPLLRLTGKR
jgi:capsular polysaccharide export protein